MSETQKPYPQRITETARKLQSLGQLFSAAQTEFTAHATIANSAGMEEARMKAHTVLDTLFDTTEALSRLMIEASGGSCQSV